MGNFNSSDNHRGLSLANILSKIFLWLLNRRLNICLNENQKLLEAKGGFRRGYYSTVDNIFILDTDTYHVRPKGSVHICIDFYKAFDQVPLAIHVNCYLSLYRHTPIQKT